MNQRSLTDHLTRRTALGGVATIGVGLPFLVACGADDTAATDSSAPAEESSAAAPSESTSESAAAPAGGLVAAADIEVGGGQVFEDEKVVVTQPAAGDFKCFTAVCTHTGCLVTEVTSDGIKCPCHGSMFSAEDGSVISGPAPAPLDAVEITVDGDQISLA